MGRNGQLERALQILFDLMRTGVGLSLEELAAAHGASTRTILRDLNALKAAGLPVDGDARDKRKLWRIDAAAETRKLRELLDKGHFLATCLALASGGALVRHRDVSTALEDLQDKIGKALGARGRKQLAAICNAFYAYDKFAYSGAAPDILWSIVSAIEARAICEITYRKPQPAARDRTFEILPLKVFGHQGGLYLMCQMIAHQTVGSLNLQRICAFKHTERRGEIPTDFAPEQLEHSAFGVHTGFDRTRYVLQFDAEVASYIRERTWHPSQELVELPQSGLELRFTCGHSFEVSAWVASWRHWVRVLEPDFLRIELRELGEALVERYG